MSLLDDRILRVRSLLKEGEALYVSDDITRRYVFHFASTAGTGYISREKCLLLLDFRYVEKARRQQERGELSKEVTVLEQSDSVWKTLSGLVKEDRIEKLLFEDKRMTCSSFFIMNRELGKQCELVPAENRVEALRAVKDEYELSCIVEAQRITDAAFSHILSFIRKGMTEREIALELEFFMRKNGADGLAFDTICVSGAKSSMPHGEPDDTVVEEGFLTMDFGARFCGYCSDMTRTVCIGTPTDEMKAVYNTVLQAQKEALDTACGGIAGKLVDKAARTVIEKAGYGDCFGHATGHSLGLEIHEAPNFSPREEALVPTGAVISVEPGIYLPGQFGVRIEDIVFLTESGCKNLTNSTKEFIILR